MLLGNIDKYVIMQAYTHIHIHTHKQMNIQTTHRVLIAENIGEFSYLDYLEENSLVNGLIMANGYFP